ncbi:MAG: tRNA (adenosine(37)-N6)-threonylcarbamoyltransferase complex ATPase subunit type 1 TsaE [Clostridia bacterium]|nr:tRNA (adenosine(37)-N6)-threonylcarbamoyltransferase complex ATPase subunit type 1 TsaE [Clostridia bacterium]
MYDVISNSAEETLALGRKIAPLLKKGDVLVMTGDLGAGKTLFTTGILEFYEKKDEVSSPTFTIVNEYDLKEDLKLFHFDVYRLESPEEFLAIGGDEFFEKGICLIEWGEKIEEYLPKDVLRINIKKDTEEEGKRIFSFSWTSSRYDELFKEVI